MSRTRRRWTTSTRPATMPPSAACCAAESTISPKALTVQYYALLREQAGRREEALTTSAPTPRATRLRSPPRCCAWRLTASSASGRHRSPRAMPSCSSRRSRAASMAAFRFSRTALDVAALRAELADPACGGYAAFEGWVRDHNEGERVRRLEYEAFEALAVREGERIIAAARERFGVAHALCAH